MYFWRSMGKILKGIWKILNITREVILNLIFIILILSVVSIIGLVSDPDGINNTPQSGVLVLDLEGVIVDSTPYKQDFYKLSKKMNNNKPDLKLQNSLFELTQKIDQATNDPNITGMILKLDNFVGGDLPNLQYVTEYLKKFKNAGKPIYAVGSNFDQKQYYLASIADKIYLINQGSVSLYGFATNNFYFKSLLDNLKVNTHVFRVGTYKSAVEPFLRDDMSPAAKENTTRWLSTMWRNYLNDIAQNRDEEADNLSPAPNIMLSRLKAVSGNISEYALENGIVDNVVSSHQADQLLNKAFDAAPELSIYDYRLNPTKMSSSAEQRGEMDMATPLIGVVFIDGTIATGQSANNVAGSDSIVKQLQELGKNKNIRAVVLRINSPGGGVYASEAIRSEIAALRQQDIPVVVSMGGMAASGGYWIATQSDYIIANPNTLTGSIGIFGIIPTFENTLAQVGIYTDGVATSPLASMNIAQNLSPEANDLIQMNIEYGYDNFISLVAESRNMTYEDVDKIAQGQVWLGEEAKELGLVDELGDFDDAVTKAASLAGLSDYQLDWPKKESDLFAILFSDYSAILPKSLAQLIYNQLPISNQLQQHIAFWDNLSDPQNRYIYCLNCSDIK
ncbi:protease-4 [Orbus hercynius]|uniref:Protease-4 n=1 Tax=Orbus hercynius TaxID=593135 RepID=A0A495RIC8_9GAMM|nr:signal peptide peptidase SppA [Orbus hercynius]RKS87109.1 protease-4 [Orbus hercynius]